MALELAFEVEQYQSIITDGTRLLICEVTQVFNREDYENLLHYIFG